MKFRWTMKELEESTDAKILRALVAERLSDLNPYAPLAKRLKLIYPKVGKEIQQKTEGMNQRKARQRLGKIMAYMRLSDI